MHIAKTDPIQRGIAFLSAASLCVTLMGPTGKGLIAVYPAPMVFGARCVGMLVLARLILRGTAADVARTAQPVAHMLRSVVQFGTTVSSRRRAVRSHGQFGATGCFFPSLAEIGLADATAFSSRWGRR